MSFQVNKDVCNSEYIRSWILGWREMAQQLKARLTTKNLRTWISMILKSKVWNTPKSRTFVVWHDATNDNCTTTLWQVTVKMEVHWQCYVKLSEAMWCGKQ